ncbi:cellulase family glycosylhydrolase, partial [bacterium]|nr:cellulase family glycosylhydrolase [bacterium]
YVGTSRFLTGVAYDDDAVLDDDFYTPGEGLGGVLIRATRQPDCVVFSATTWDSGGYSLLLEPGTYDVVATSNDLGRVEYVGVVIGDDNVKRDYTPDMSTLDETGPVVNVVSPAVTSPFVQVSGTGFVADGGPFYVAGTNSYYLMEYAANPATRSQVDEALQDAADMGLNVVRTWAFADGYTAYDEDLLVDDPYLQPQPGVYNEAFFQGLDYTIYKAGQLGLRLTLPLVNHWEPYGGMDQYVAWDSTYGTAPFATERNDFYTDDDTVVWYKDHVSAVLNRVNTFTGTAYKDDPTIFSWELANEPRAEWDWSGDLLQDWIDDMADHVKSIDSTHLLTTGLEGFYDGSGDGDWMRNGFSGTDFVRNHTGDTIDYAVLHNWPEHWALDEAGSVAWYQEHIDDAHGVLGKPVVMEEFGLSRDDDGTSATERDSLFQALLDTGEAADAAGWNFWVLYDDAYTDYDGFGVYSPADRSTAAILSGAADALAAKTVPALPLFAGVTTIEVHFNEAMDPATIVAANIELLGSGGDGVFGNGNDIVYAPASVVLDPDGCTSHINLASALPADKYRFTLDGTSSITDAAGNRLDGEYLGSLPSGDGTPGGDFVGAFVVAETPESLGVDMAARVGGEPNPTGPAPRTLGLTGIVSRVNPSSTLYAVQVSGGDWLRFDSAAGRTDVYADGSAPEWRTAQEWARNRLRGLDAGATYEFLAMAGDGAGSQTPLVAVGAYATNASGDVNATGGLRPVRGSDFALVRYAAGASGRLGIELLWAGDNNDDGVIDQTDVYDVLDLLKHPSGAATGAVGQGAVAASTFTDSSEPTPLTSMEALLVMEYLEQREDDRTEASGIVTPGERLDAAAAWDEETNG